MAVMPDPSRLGLVWLPDLKPTPPRPNGMAARLKSFGSGMTATPKRLARPKLFRFCMVVRPKSLRSYIGSRPKSLGSGMALRPKALRYGMDARLKALKSGMTSRPKVLKTFSIHLICFLTF
jgi:hypothetical protein